MIFTSFEKKNSRLQDPDLKSLVNKCSVCVLWPYFSDFKMLVFHQPRINVAFSKHNHVHTCCSHIIVAQFVLITVLLDCSHMFISN